jgi:LmbE family N-acetylglucosaminyl deacetylase
MNILAIGAHPDDLEIGCGGTLIKYADKGHKIHLLIMTRGALGGDPEIRATEQMAAIKVMGCCELTWGGFTDTEIKVSNVVIERIEAVVAEIDPGFVFCHYPDDTHQDHRHLAQTVISATRYAKNVLFYEGPTSQHFNPSVFVDISSTLDRKIKALEAHGSQIDRTNIEGCSILEIAHSSAIFRGIQARVKFAEAFVPLRLFINV